MLGTGPLRGYYRARRASRTPKLAAKMRGVKFTQYKNVVIEPELGIDIDMVADEIMNKMAKDGWQVVNVCPHTRPGKLLVTFGK